jgi:hypothetical protein
VHYQPRRPKRPARTFSQHTDHQYACQWAGRAVLMTEGLLVRQASSRDRRAHELQVTDDGRLILRGIEPAVQAARAVAGMTADEADELMRLLRKAIAAGNELSRAPLREASTTPQRSNRPRALVLPGDFRWVKPTAISRLSQDSFFFCLGRCCTYRAAIFCLHPVGHFRTALRRAVARTV